MMLLATFFPASELPGGLLDIKGEFLKITVDIVDLVGLHLVMSRTSGKAEVKFLVAGVGWATAELIMTRFIPLWVGARRTQRLQDFDRGDHQRGFRFDFVGCSPPQISHHFRNFSSLAQNIPGTFRRHRVILRLVIKE